MAKVIVVNPLSDPEWNRTLADISKSTIFHSANWAAVLKNTYGYRPKYPVLYDGGTFRGCLPLIEVDSLITGRRGVCVTFSDYCEALVEDGEDFELLFQVVQEMGRASGWRYVEFRGDGYLKSHKPAKTYYHHVIDLSEGQQKMWGRLRESTARNIRKASREGVMVQISTSLEDLKEFYRLHCQTRRRHGLPPQPVRFFHNLHKHVISKGYGFTALARRDAESIAGIVCLHFGRHAVYKYGASDPTFQHLRANNLVLWEAMCKCAQEGVESFSLGRTDLDNDGLLAFKNGWGGRENQLSYYRYNFATETFDPPSVTAINYAGVLQRLPIKVLRWLGWLAYPHLG